MNEILRQPSVLLFLTLAVYALAIIVRTRTGNIFCNPVLVSTIVLIAYLKILDIDYAVYHNAAQFIDFLAETRRRRACRAALPKPP